MVKPLSEEERKQLEQLQSRAAAEQSATDQQIQKQKVEAFAPVQALLDLIDISKFMQQSEEIMRNGDVSFELKQKVKALQSAVNFGVTSIASLRPTPIP